MKDQAIVERIRKLVESEGSKAGAARKLGISRPYLHEILKGHRGLGPKVLAHFGLKRETRIVKEV